jgi:hypothetical protein
LEGIFINFQEIPKTAQPPINHMRKYFPFTPHSIFGYLMAVKTKDI